MRLYVNCAEPVSFCFMNVKKTPGTKVGIGSDTLLAKILKVCNKKHVVTPGVSEEVPAYLNSPQINRGIRERDGESIRNTGWHFVPEM